MTTRMSAYSSSRILFQMSVILLPPFFYINETPCLWSAGKGCNYDDRTISTLCWFVTVFKRNVLDNIWNKYGIL